MQCGVQVNKVLCAVEDGVDLSLSQDGLRGGGQCQERFAVELRTERGGRRGGRKEGGEGERGGVKERGEGEGEKGGGGGGGGGGEIGERGRKGGDTCRCTLGAHSVQ